MEKRVPEPLIPLRSIEHRVGAHPVDEALDDLEALSMEGLILDLRGNPGGYLSMAVRVADEHHSILVRSMIGYCSGNE